MESVNTSKASSRGMQQDQSSRQRRKLTFTITFAVIFSLIIGSIITVFAILKHNIEAEGLSANPTTAIRVVCSLTPYPRSCSKSLSENLIIYPSSTINPTKVFTLSLHAAIKELNDLISTTQAEILKAKNSKTFSALKDCEKLFKDSMRLVNNTMEVMEQFDPDENVFKEDKFVIRILPIWMSNATENIERCLNKMEYRGWDTSGDKYEMRMMEIEKKIPSMAISSMILVKMEAILELFDPRFGSVLANLLSIRGYVFIVSVFCSQYLFLVLLIVLVLKS